MQTLSLSLAFVALLSHVVYGFSSQSTNHVINHHRSRNAFGIMKKTTTPTSPFVSATTTRDNNNNNNFMNVRGGSNSAQEASISANTESTTGCPFTNAMTITSSFLGTGGVIYILFKAIARVLPIALEPFKEGSVPLSQFQLGAYFLTCIWFAYVEGYKGFQQKFSPLVVKRSFTLVPGKNGTKWYHFLFAPMYSMGLIHATKKRKIVSWSITLGVTAIVGAVKKLPYPWRNIVDAGVVAGLSWGSLSIMYFFMKSWMDGKPPEIDAALPEATSK